MRLRHCPQQFPVNLTIHQPVVVDTEWWFYIILIDIDEMNS